MACNTESFLGITHAEATGFLKQMTGVVRFLVVNPHDEIDKRNNQVNDEKKTETLEVPAKIDDNKSAKTTPAPSPGRRTSLAPPSPAAPKPTSPAKSPAKTPTKTDDNKIEVKLSDGKGLGLNVVGGNDTVNKSVHVLDVFKDGAAAKSGKLQIGDKIVSLNGITALETLKHQDVVRIIRKNQDKVSFVIERPDGESSAEEIDVELIKKGGKGLGISLASCAAGNGIYIYELVNNFYMHKYEKY